MTEKLDGYLSTEQVAERLQRSQRHVQTLIAQGRLLAARVGRAYLVHESTLESFSLRPSGPRPGSKRTKREREPIVT